MCVDPSTEMLLAAERREGLTPYLATADAFLSSDLKQKCNKILMHTCAHLFPDPFETFLKAAEYLPQLIHSQKHTSHVEKFTGEVCQF